MRSFKYIIVMDVERKETNFVCSSPPYVDSVVILDGNSINYSTNPDSLSIPHQIRLDYSAEFRSLFRK